MYVCMYVCMYYSRVLAELIEVLHGSPESPQAPVMLLTGQAT
jgi:hypothetical protein